MGMKSVCRCDGCTKLDAQQSLHGLNTCPSCKVEERATDNPDVVMVYIKQIDQEAKFKKLVKLNQP